MQQKSRRAAADVKHVINGADSDDESSTPSWMTKLENERIIREHKRNMKRIRRHVKSLKKSRKEATSDSDSNDSSKDSSNDDDADDRFGEKKVRSQRP